MFVFNRPLILICISFIFGILAASLVGISLLFCYVCLFFSCLSALLTMRQRKLFVVFLALSCFYLGYCHFINAQILPKNHINNLTPYKGKYVQVKGVVVSEPIQKKNKGVFVFQCNELIRKDVGAGLTSARVQGKVLVNLYQDSEIIYGQEVVLMGKLYRPFSFPGEDGFNYRAYLKKQRIFSILSVSKKGKIEYTGHNLGNPVKRLAFYIQNKAEGFIDTHMSGPASGVMKAMILGQRGDAPKFFNEALKRTGTVHILAVSGLHVGIVALIVILILKMMQIPFKARYLLSIIILIFYCMLTGGRTSVVRATLMAVTFLISVLIGRDYDPYSALSLAALIILWFAPQQIFDLGFQLSFISVLAIFIFSPKIMGIFPKQILENKCGKYLIGSISVSISAWLGTLGIIAYYFNIITPIAILANLFIVPLLFVIVASSFLFIFLGGLISILAGSLALSCEFFITMLYKLNSGFLLIPGAYYNIPDISIHNLIMYYSFLVGVFGLLFYRGSSEAAGLTNEGP
ncbi:MAG: ComEC/Rec2 family competence protein [PVC group bacterium]|nr:ComEC/Rec2 family competence protein [PVC group bacterium]